MGICQRGGFGFGSSLFRIFADPHCCLLVTRLLSSCLGASPMPTVCYYCLLSTILAPSSMKSVRMGRCIMRYYAWMIASTNE